MQAPKIKSKSTDTAYKKWLSTLPEGHQRSINPATGNGYDYDYRQYFKENGAGKSDGNGHFTDRYKLPNHRTFSTESMYYNAETKDQAGSWSETSTGGNQWSPINSKVKGVFQEDRNGNPVKDISIPIGGKAGEILNPTKYKMGTRNIKSKQKAATGLNKVVVPPAGSTNQVAQSALSLGQTGFTVGGPIGAGVGALAGGALGLLQKSQQDKANREAEAQNVYIGNSRLYNGTDVSEYQNTQEFANGTEATNTTKQIEVEKDELIFRKVGNTFKLKADFVGGKSHTKGGENYVASDGDIIFPGKMRSKVLSLHNAGNHSALEGLRMKLPKDTNPQREAKNGVDYLSYLQPTIGALSTSLPTTLPTMGGANQVVGGLSEEQVNAGFSATGAQTAMAPYDYGGNASFSSSSGLPNAGNSYTAAEGSGLDIGNISQYASLANNIYQGLQTPERVEENYMNPQLLKYADRSEPQRRASRLALTSQKNAARNAGGGNAQVIRATQAAAQVGNTNRLMDIDNTEQQRADQVTATNTQLLNQAEQINAQKRDVYSDLNARNRAATESYRDAAASQLSSLGNVQEQQKYQKSLDAKKDVRDQDYLHYLNMTTQFMTDENGDIVFNPNAQVRPKGRAKTVTEMVDKNGKKSTRSTIKTK